MPAIPLLSGLGGSGLVVATVHASTLPQVQDKPEQAPVHWLHRKQSRGQACPAIFPFAGTGDFIFASLGAGTSMPESSRMFLPTVRRTLTGPPATWHIACVYVGQQDISHDEKAFISHHRPCRGVRLQRQCRARPAPGRAGRSSHLRCERTAPSVGRATRQRQLGCASRQGQHPGVHLAGSACSENPDCAQLNAHGCCPSGAVLILVVRVFFASVCVQKTRLVRGGFFVATRGHRPRINP